MIRDFALLSLCSFILFAAGCASHRGPTQQDREILAQIAAQDASRPLADRIRERESLIDRLQSRESTHREMTRLAALYGELGTKQAAEGEPAKAQASYEKANELDPTNPAYCGILGKLFADQAAMAGDADTCLRFYEQASEHWRRAVALESEGDRKAAYRTGAARALYDYARLLAKAGRKEDALVKLYDARELAPPHSDVAGAIDRLLKDLGR